ncbi:hypothetical protein DSECCO2_591420 [anaerobic digester metagenome]
MHGTADNVADGDGDERNRSKQNALNRSDDRAGARDIQKVNQTVFPFFHRDVVHAILFCNGRRLTIVRAEYLFAERTIDSRTTDKND